MKSNGYRKLHIDLSKEKKWRRPTSNLREIKTFYIEVSQNPLQKWDKIPKKNSKVKPKETFGSQKIITKTSIYIFQIKWCGGPFSEVSRYSRITRQTTLILFHNCFVLAFGIFTFWTIARYSITFGYCSTKSQLFFSLIFYPLPARFCVLEKRTEYFPLVTCKIHLVKLMFKILCSFQHFCSLFA